jgi:hypothetical protein
MGHAAPTFFYHPVTWLCISALLIGACTYLPLWIKNDALRSFVMRWILVPISLVIILYVYPVGIKVFSTLN